MTENERATMPDVAHIENAHVAAIKRAILSIIDAIPSGDAFTEQVKAGEICCLLIDIGAEAERLAAELDAQPDAGAWQQMVQENDELQAELVGAEARIANLLGANEALELRIDELVTDQEVARSLAYWQRIADYHFAKRQAAEARAERWRAYALAWERYDDSFWLGVDDEETDRAKELLDATYGQLREFGDMPDTDGGAS